MLNNSDDDYITNMAMSLLLNNYISRKINSMRNFDNTENKGGILNGEFIKKHLERETELEDKIFELEERIKRQDKIFELNERTNSLIKNSINNIDTNSDLYYSKNSIYYSILQGMAPYMSISMNPDNDISVSINDCPINDMMAKCLKALIFEYSDQIKSNVNAWIGNSNYEVITSANPRVYESTFDYDGINSKAIAVKTSENSIVTKSTYIDPIDYSYASIHKIDTCSNNA